MAAEDTTTRTRKSAEERRAQIIALAMEQFALGGYRGTSTEAIARQAGISQPYLFRLFKTKRELFLACSDLCDARILATFREAAAGAPAGEVLPAMGKAYVQLLQDRTMLLFQMQAYSTSEPEIRAYVRENYRELIRNVAALAGVEEKETWEFFAHGMLLNVIASLDLAAIAERDEWACAWSAPLDLIRMST